MNEREWYFVTHLLPDDASEYGGAYEVQYLNSSGAALGVGYVDGTKSELVITLDFEPRKGEPATEPRSIAVPASVLSAVRTYAPGVGGYVDAAGRPVDLFGNPDPQSIPTDPELIAAMLLETAQRIASMPSPNLQGAVRTARGIVSQYPGTKAADQAMALLQRLGETSGRST